MPNVVLEWWQWIAVAVGALGFSAAPWIAALLFGKLKTYDVWKSEKDRADYERARADRAVEKLVELAGEYGETAVKLLDAIPKKGEPK